jgi:RPA family protein
MSADEDDGPVGTREVAYRVFAAEFDDADYSHRDSDEERAPSYVITPSGAKANRLFLVGVLTEVEDVNEDMLRARIVDPTGAFVVYAGQYQPDARTFFERTDPPQFVAVSGKARTFEPDDGDRVFTSVRPEGVSAVDADTRDRWVVDAARQTVDRVGAMAGAIEAGADEDPAAAGLDPAGGIALALDHYGTTPGYLAALRDLALDATRVVAGERDEVSPLSADPDDPTQADLAALVALGGGDAAPVEPADAGAETDPEPTDDDEPAGSDAPEPADDGATEGGSAEAEEPAETADEATEAADATAESGDATAESGDATGGSGAEATDDELGDFEPGGLTTGEDEEADASGEADEPTDSDPPAGADAADAGAEEPPDVGDEMYEFDEEERQEIEEEYGAEFSTGTEVDAPGEAGIETPSPEDADGDEPAAESAGEGSESDADGEPESVTGEDDGAAATDEASDDGDDEPAEDVGLDELVIDRMRELDDGDGADREELIAAVVDETGADPGAVEDAIQDALMGGQCYEPADDRLKPI